MSQLLINCIAYPPWPDILFHDCAVGGGVNIALVSYQPAAGNGRFRCHILAAAGIEFLVAYPGVDGSTWDVDFDDVAFLKEADVSAHCCLRANVAD